MGICLLHVKSQPLDVYALQRQQWESKAANSIPVLIERIHEPVSIVKAEKDSAAFQGWKMTKINTPILLYGKSMKDIKSVILDFGKHLTGYLTLNFEIIKKTQDAPIRLKLTFGELPAEICTQLTPWEGKLSRAWMQDEIITVSDITQPLTLNRRMAFRYVRIELLAQSSGFDFAIKSVNCKAVSSAGDIQTRLSSDTPQIIKRIHDVSMETLHECMQTVYEDGPKRDRRLWLGDLYLESLANRYSYRNFDLTKHCLYLFASLSAKDGRLISNCFEQPFPHPQVDSYCMPYGLLFNSTLLEYFNDTSDKETAEDLWPVAKIQVNDALKYVDSNGLFNVDRCTSWLFFDWKKDFDVSVSMQGAILFAIDQTIELAKKIGKAEDMEIQQWQTVSANMRKAARKHQYDPKRGIMVGRKNRQVSLLSQAWAIKGGILSSKEGARALRMAMTIQDCVMPATPYATHYVIDAMHLCDMHDDAMHYIKQYWGGMVEKGADTFWEVYDPDDDYASPYNFFPLNSACHAWSCTPIYFIHKYPNIYQNYE